MSSYRVARFIAALGACVLLLAACALPRDGEPQPIATDKIPQALRPGQLPTATPVFSDEVVFGFEQIFMVGGDNRLVPVDRKEVTTPREAIDELLLATSPEERSNGITTAITRATAVQGIEVNDLFRLATVDLAPGSLSAAENSEQKLAFGQLVYTLTSLDGIEQVAFVQSDPNDPEAEPTLLAVQTDNGTTLPGKRVTRDEYLLISPVEEEEGLPPQPPIGFDIEVPTETAEVAASDTPGTPLVDIPIWLVDDRNRLVEVTRQAQGTIEDELLSLFAGTLPEDRDAGLRSALPPDALANALHAFDVQVDEQGGSTTIGLAFLDLSQGSLPLVDDGIERDLALAQIVYTISALDSVDRVVISVDGESEKSDGFTREDYAAFAPAGTLPSPTPTSLPTPTATPEP